MTDADDDSGTPRSVRVTASHDEMAVLGDDDPDTAGPTAPTPPVVLDPREPVSLLGPADPAGILRRQAGLLATLGPSASLDPPVPELVFRPPRSPAEAQDDASPDADGSQTGSGSGRDAGQPVAAPGRPAPAPMRVASPRPLPTSSGAGDPDDAVRPTTPRATPPERRVRERTVTPDAEAAAPPRGPTDSTDDAPPRPSTVLTEDATSRTSTASMEGATSREPTTPRPPEFTYVSPPWSGESGAGEEASPAGSTPSGSEDSAGPEPPASTGPDARESGVGEQSGDPVPDERSRPAGPDGRPGTADRGERPEEAGAGGPRHDSGSAPGDLGPSSVRDTRPTEQPGGGSFPVSVSPPTDPRGRDPARSGERSGGDPTVAVRSAAATDPPSTAGAGFAPVSRTPLTVVRRLADASPGQAAAAEDDRTTAAGEPERGAGEGSGGAVGRPTRPRSETPGAPARPGFTVVDHSVTASPRSRPADSARPDASRRSSPAGDAPPLAGDEARPTAPVSPPRPRFTVVDRPEAASQRTRPADPARPDASRRSSPPEEAPPLADEVLPGGVGGEAPADVAGDVPPPDTGETDPASAGRRFDPTARRRTVDAPAEGTRASPTASGGAIPLVVRRRQRRDRPDDAATGGTRTVGERPADPGPVAGPEPGATGGDSPPAEPSDAAVTDDLHRLPLSAAADAAPGGESLIETDPSSAEGMPSMTLRSAGGGGRRSGGGDAGASRRSSAGAGSGPERGSAGAADRGGGSPSSGADRGGGVDRRPGSGGAPTRDATHSREASPPSGRDASTVYPEFTFKTLAPRVDATRTEASERRDVTHRDDGRSGESTADRADVADVLSGGDLERSTSPADVDRLVEKLQRDIERKRRIDRERRGL